MEKSLSSTDNIGKFKISFSGVSNELNPKKPMSSIDFTASITGLSGIDGSNNKTEEVKFSMIVIDKTLYVKIVSFPGSDTKDLAPVRVFMNNWLKLDLQNVIDTAIAEGELPEEASAMLSSGILFNSNSPELVKLNKALKESFKNSQGIVLTNKLASKGDGINYYSAVINKVAIKKTIATLINSIATLMDLGLAGEITVTEKDLSELDEALYMLKPGKMEIGLDKKNNALRSVKMDFKLINNDSVATNEEVSSKMNLVFSDYNKDIKIKEPETFIDLQEMLNSTLNKSNSIE